MPAQVVQNHPCAATVESMVTELEVVEVMDRLLERVELDAHYREMRETSSVPPLATRYRSGTLNVRSSWLYEPSG